MTCLQCKDSKLKPKITCNGSAATLTFNCGCKFDVKIDGGPVKVITKQANLGNAQTIEWRTHNCKPCKQKEAAWQTLETGCNPPAGQLIKQECAGSSLKQYFTDGKGGQTVTMVPFVVNFTATVSGCNDVNLAWADIAGASFVLKRNGQPMPSVVDENLANGTYTYTLDVTTKEGCTFTETASATVAVGNLTLRIESACQNVTLSWSETTGPYTLRRDSTVIYEGNALLTNDNDLANGNYTYTLTDGCGQTANGTATVNKPTPENSTFTATVTNCNTITLAWSSIANTKFTLYRNGTQIYSGYDSSFVDSNKADETYVYRLKISLDWQESPCFTELYQTVVIAKPTITLTATATNCTVNLSWPALGGATNYTVKRGTTEIYSGTGLSTVDTGLANGSYSYTITATIGTCTVSATASATVTKPTVTLSASVSCKNVNLTATAISGASYVFKRGTTTLTSSGNTCVDSNLANGSYSYSVAVSVGGCTITATASASINVKAYGTLISQGACVGAYRTNVYADGLCGQYTSQVQDCAGCCTPSGVLISQGACNGSSRTNTYSDGCCGSYTQTVQDCAGCCPPSGTFISSECVGTTKRSTYADGCCGTYSTDAVNSIECGYCAPQWTQSTFVYQYLPTGSLNTDNTIRTLTSGRQNFPQTYYVIEFSKNCACFNIEIISITCTTPTTDARGGHVLGCNGINQCRYNRGLVSDNNPTPPAMGPSPVSNFYGTFTNVERVKMELNSRFTVNVRIW